MWYQSLILAIILSLFPLIAEGAIEGYRTIVKKRRDKHFLSACIRIAFILAAGFGNPLLTFWWQGSLLAFSLHYLLFDALFNHWVLDKRPDYWGNNIIDKIHKWIASKITLQGLYAIKLMIFASAIKFYIDPYIW